MRALAHTYRAMASDGDDLHLKAMLRQPAEEFEREAADLEGHASVVTNDTKQPAGASRPKPIVA
ncbi:hypothetical protein [Rhodopila globiformis]|uniref:hypothetical protein n=1 Tax=Rhodopila globiformis TaxID=1071 RepID=UPI0011B058A6|nr:hypothetical protein [Rhodopila globiformis]